jgi:hypothetical protein
MINPQDSTLIVQAAIKNMVTNGVFYFGIPVAMECLFAAKPAMDVTALVTAWKEIDVAQEASVVINDLPTIDIEKIKSKLATNDISFVAKRDVPGADGQPQSAIYFSCVTITNNSFLVELKLKAGMNLCKVTVKSTNKVLSELCKVTVVKILMTA